MPEWIVCLHLTLPLAFSSVTPTLCMSYLATSMNVVFCFSLILLPSSPVFNTLFPVYLISLLCTCANHLSLAGLSSANGSTPAVPRTWSFRICCILDTPKQKLIIFNYADTICATHQSSSHYRLLKLAFRTCCYPCVTNHPEFALHPRPMDWLHTWLWVSSRTCKRVLENAGIDPAASHMQSERSTI